MRLPFGENCRPLGGGSHGDVGLGILVRQSSFAVAASSKRRVAGFSPPYSHETASVLPSGAKAKPANCRMPIGRGAALLFANSESFQTSFPAVRSHTRTVSSVEWL